MQCMIRTLLQIISVGDDEMSRNNKNIPVSEPEKSEYICPSASWGDMTGLIPFAAEDSAECSSCEGVYPYLSEYGGNKAEKH